MALLALLNAVTACVSRKSRCTKRAKWNYYATTHPAPKATSATRFAVFATHFAVFATHFVVFATRFAIFTTRLLVKIPNVGILCSQRWKYRREPLYDNREPLYDNREPLYDSK